MADFSGDMIMSQGSFLQTVSEINLTSYLKKFMTLVFISCFSILSAAEYQYELRDLGTLSFSRNSNLIDLNDQGQVLMSIREENGEDRWHSDQKFGLWDIEKGFRYIPVKENEEIKHISKINNQGWMIGIAQQEIIEQYAKNNDEDYEEDEDWYVEQERSYTKRLEYPFIWDPMKNEIVLLKMLNEDSKLIDINDRNQIIGLHDENNAYFIYENQELKYLNLEKELNEIGFHALSYSLLKINNKGEILGKFNYGVKHPYKDKWQEAGTQYFLWDGQIKLIEGLSYPSKNYHTPSFYLNDKSEVFFKLDNHPRITTFKWDPVNGTQQYVVPKEFPDLFNVKSISHNMLNAIEQYGDKTTIWQNGKITYKSFLEDSIHGLFDSSQFPEIEFKSLEKINDRGQIVLRGKIWDETHYFLMDPIQ